MRKFIGVAVALAMAGPGLAESLKVYPVQSGAETARYRIGVPTLSLETKTGAVQITPLPFDHGKVSFGLAIYNKGTVATNLGIENMSATLGGLPMPILSSEELQKRAKSRAAWSAVGIALLAGAAAAAAANAHTTQTSRGYMRTPRGTYSWAAVHRDNTIGVLGASAAVAGGAAGIVGIQNRLDWTLDNLASDIIQTTTIDPDESYGGQIVLEKSSKVKVPYDVTLAVSLNGDTYPFRFRVTKDGVNVPPPYTTAPTARPDADKPERAPETTAVNPASATPAVVRTASTSAEGATAVVVPALAANQR